MKTFKQLISEVARAQSPADKEFVALHPVSKKQFVKYPEGQFKGTTHKDTSKEAHMSNVTGMEDEVEKEKPLGEEENLMEISKKTLGSYIKKASGDVGMHMADYGSSTTRSVHGAPGSMFKKQDEDGAKRAIAKARKRKAGIEKATDKLTKEEVEQIEELSKATLASYAGKAAADMRSSAEGSRNALHAAKDHDRSGDHDKGDKSMDYSHHARAVADKRQKGLHTAIKKLAK